MPSHVECWRGCHLPHGSSIHDMVCLLNLLSRYRRKCSFGDVPGRLSLPLGLSFFPSPSLRAVRCAPRAAVSALVLVVSCVRGEAQTQDQRTAEPDRPLSLWPSSPLACCRTGQGGENVCWGASLCPRVLTGVYRKLSSEAHEKLMDDRSVCHCLCGSERHSRKP